MHRNLLLDKNRPGRRSSSVGHTAPAWLSFSSSNDWIQHSLKPTCHRYRKSFYLCVTQQMAEMIWNPEVLFSLTFVLSYGKKRLPVPALPHIPGQIPTHYSLWNNAEDSPLSSTVCPSSSSDNLIVSVQYFSVSLRSRRAGVHLLKTNTGPWYRTYCHLISHHSAPKHI